MRHLLIGFILLPVLAAAQELHVFRNGESADAEKVNENFSALEQQLDSLKGDQVLVPWADHARFMVDCSADPLALQKTLESEAAMRLNSVHAAVQSGSCRFPDHVFGAGRTVWISAPEEGASMIFSEEVFCSLGVKNGHVTLTRFALTDLSAICLYANASLQLESVSFVSTQDPLPAEGPIVIVRNDSLLRFAGFADKAASSVRPSIYATNSDIDLAVGAAAYLGDIDLALGSRMWCRECGLDALALRLDTNSSFCGYTPGQGGADLGITSLNVRAGSVFLHENAPESTASSYEALVSSDSTAIWEKDGTGDRCGLR